ncbi:MAG TPA: cytidylate kinase-like family protein [Anaerolineales bacterium]
MSTITISREIGSKGDWIAEECAKRLGFYLVTKHTLERIFLQYGFVEFNEKYDEDVSSFWARFDPQLGEMVGMLNRITLTLAAYGNVVLVGRGGFAMLKNYMDVLNVRIQAPLPLRISAVMREQKLTEQTIAESIVRESDQVRQHFLDTAYGSRWNSTGSFDLVVDTGKITPEMAIEWVVDTTIRLRDRNLTFENTTASLVIDPVLMKSIEEVLEKD